MSLARQGSALAADQLVVSHYPGHKKLAPALLMIHGWGASNAIWVDVLDELQRHFDIYLLELPGVGINQNVQCASIKILLELFERDVLSRLPANCALVGWSLGGMLTACITQQFPRSFCAQVIVGSSPQFVQSDTWQHGMDTSVFKQFEVGIRNDADRFLKRFRALQTLGAPSAKSDLNWLNNNAKALKAPKSGQLLTGLQWLSQSRLQPLWLNPAVPTLYQYGAQDNLVPQSLVSYIRESSNKRVSVELFARSAHLPFLSERKRWLQSVCDFLLPHAQFTPNILPCEVTSNDNNLDKKAVAHAFSKAAPLYDDRAAFQHQLGARLVQMVATHKFSEQCTILDLGAGTGYAQPALKKLAGGKEIIALDMAKGMLDRSQHKNSDTLHVLGDIEHLPFASKSFDLVYANLSLQWCTDYPAVFKNIGRNLKANGCFAFTTLLPGSLCELKKAAANIGDGSHINEFVTSDAIKAAICEREFNVQKWIITTEQYFHAGPAQLLNSVRGIGAGNHRMDRRSKITGKKNYRAFIGALEKQHCPNKGIPLSYCVLTAVLRRVE